MPVTPLFIYSWPHTHPIRGATLNLFQKTWVLGSGNWVRLRSAKSGEGQLTVRSIYPIFGAMEARPSAALPSAAWPQAKAKSMPKHRVFGSYGRDEEGKQTRTVYSPGGNTRVGMQTLNTTPNGFNEAWFFKCPDEKAREKDDVQSIRNSRKKQA